ncbi:MAG: hypothetical protein KGJ11_02050 [Candidatus Omnitrophica bacterium]|nr:hypothetical protein [Candidatus Omnitrophota bacterium]
MKKIISVFTLLCFLWTSLGVGPVYSQTVAGLALPAPGQMVPLSPAFSPAVLKGIQLDPKSPFRFHFFVDTGDSHLSRPQLKDVSSKLIKYFLASLTVPEKDLWVNLSPYEKNRIVPQEFGQTVMGRDLLAEDYILKQITASLIYPESKIGKKFWKKVYVEAQAKYGTTNIPINTFNKVWIVPDKAVVYENGGTAFVLENHLKVMLEQDYLSLAKHEGIQGVVPQGKETNQLGNQIVRKFVIPQLEKEVNEGKNFAQLRQVFYSLILATWYKKKIKDSILNKIYSNQNKIGGVNVSVQDKDRIYQEYLKAFKKGVFNYIQEDPLPDGQVVPRKYFSGGVIGAHLDAAMVYENLSQVKPTQLADLAQSSIIKANVEFTLISRQKDNAMLNIDKVRSYLENPAHRYNPVDFIASKIKKGEINVIGLGEEHSSVSFKRFERRFADELIKQRLITHCAVEMPKSFERPIQQFLALWKESPNLRPIQVAALMKSFPKMKLAAEKILSLYPGFSPNETTDEIMLMLRDLYIRGVTLLFIDPRPESSQEESVDQNMAQVIINTIQKNKRARILLAPFGRNHIRNSGMGRIFSSAPQIRYYSINLMEPEISSIHQTLLTSLFFHQDETVDFSRAITNSDFHSDIFLIPNLSETPMGEIWDSKGKKLQEEYDGIIWVGSTEKMKLVGSDAIRLAEQKTSFDNAMNGHMPADETNNGESDKVLKEINQTNRRTFLKHLIVALSGAVTTGGINITAGSVVKSVVKTGQAIPALSPGALLEIRSIIGWGLLGRDFRRLERVFQAPDLSLQRKQILTFIREEVFEMIMMHKEFTWEDLPTSSPLNELSRASDEQLSISTLEQAVQLANMKEIASKKLAENPPKIKKVEIMNGSNESTQGDQGKLDETPEDSDASNFVQKESRLDQLAIERWKEEGGKILLGDAAMINDQEVPEGSMVKFRRWARKTANKFKVLSDELETIGKMPEGNERGVAGAVFLKNLDDGIAYIDKGTGLGLSETVSNAIPHTLRKDLEQIFIVKSPFRDTVKNNPKLEANYNYRTLSYYISAIQSQLMDFSRFQRIVLEKEPSLVSGRYTFDSAKSLANSAMKVEGQKNNQRRIHRRYFIYLGGAGATALALGLLIKSRRSYHIIGSGHIAPSVSEVIFRYTSMAVNDASFRDKYKQTIDNILKAFKDRISAEQVYHDWLKKKIVQEASIPAVGIEATPQEMATVPGQIKDELALFNRLYPQIWPQDYQERIKQISMFLYGPDFILLTQVEGRRDIFIPIDDQSTKDKIKEQLNLEDELRSQLPAEEKGKTAFLSLMQKVSNDNRPATSQEESDVINAFSPQYHDLIVKALSDLEILNGNISALLKERSRRMAINCEKLPVGSIVHVGEADAKDIRDIMEKDGFHVRMGTNTKPDGAMKANPTVGKVMVNKNGGIDLNPAQMSMQVKKEGQDFKFQWNGQTFDAAQITGATFKIETMTPVADLSLVLGLKKAAPEMQLSQLN